ncbi:MAG: hypothetical protein ACRCS9_14000 [Hyphomicrobium sp.]
MMVVGRTLGLLKPLLQLVGVLLAAAIGVDAVAYDVPVVRADQMSMLLAALLVFAGR